MIIYECKFGPDPIFLHSTFFWMKFCYMDILTNLKSVRVQLIPQLSRYNPNPSGYLPKKLPNPNG